MARDERSERDGRTKRDGRTGYDDRTGDDRTGDDRTEHDRAQVGIGTLVVFVAMVLVAAIAAGVLLDTAGVLENRAEATGHEATGQVSNRLMVVSAYGHVTDEVVNAAPKSRSDVMPNESVDTVELTVKLAPGSGPVNLSRATVSWVGPQNSTTLVHGKAADYAPGVVNRGDPGTFGLGGGGGRRTDDQTNPHEVFNTHALVGGDHTVLTEESQRVKVYVNAGLVEAGTRDAVTPPYAEPLDEGTEVELRITTASGATTVYRLTVPESLSEEEFVTL